MASNTSILTILFALAFVVCASAKSFQATCTFDDSTKGRAASRPSRRGRRVSASAPTRKALYGVKSGVYDVVIKAQADDLVTIYVDGSETGASTPNCHHFATAPETLTGGEVVSFVATNTGGSYGLYAAIVSADGQSVYATTGQSGWKAMPLAQAPSNWMDPSFDASGWPDMVPSTIYSGCGPDSEIIDTGAASMWSATYDAKIAVRFVVPGPDCHCNEGECPDHYCRYCLFNQGDNRLVCYKDWNKDMCDDAGGAYTWCGN